MPQIFEFHFNPPRKEKLASGKEDTAFDTFCFEPKNVYEKRMGGLYMAGLLKNILPQNARFLEILAEKIKDKYYKSASSSPEKSLRESLRVANEHLEKIAKEGDVSWLGNISFSVISLKNHELNFTKIGNLKTLLVRKGQIIDIDQKLKFDEIEPYPLKVFGNIVSGKLAQDDIMLLMSHSVYEAFIRENLINDIARKSLSDSPSTEIKKFGNVLNNKKEQLLKLSGICLLIILSKEEASKEKETISEKKPLKMFSFREALNPVFKLAGKIKLPKKIFKPKMPKPRISLPDIGLSKPKTKIFLKMPYKGKKKLIIIIVFILILAAGFFLFQKSEERNIEAYQIQINGIKEKMELAESYLLLAEYNPLAKKNANTLYKEAWNEVSPLLNASLRIPKAINNQASEVKDAISEKLYSLNKLIEIAEPEIVFEFKAKEYVPQKLISSKDKIYFFSPLSENVFELDIKEKQGRIIETNRKFNEAAVISDSIAFFSKPNEITLLKDNSFQEPVNLQDFFAEPDLASLSFYRSNLYFLDKKNGAIIRYPFPSETNPGLPESWLSSEIKTATNFESMAVDGSIWVLTKKNTIERYYSGIFQEALALDMFPEPKNFSRIFTSLELPHLYLLEPEQKRIVILDKTGQTVKQYYSDKFDNLLGFSLSQDGKTIWLLNGLKVFSISVQP